MRDRLGSQTSSRRRGAGRRRPNRLSPSLAVLIAGLLGVACVSTQESADPVNAIHIGSTLPFSGTRAASGVALETALRLAIDRVNSAMVLPRPLAIEVRDSHSDDALGTANTLALLQEEDIPFFIGPEEPRIAYQIANAIKAQRMVNLLPGLGSPQIHDSTARAAWFRLSPSPNYLACALAKRMFKDGITRANAVTDPDDYSATFATIFGRVFTSMGGTLLPGLQLPASGSNFAEVFATIERFSPDATMLITSPSVAAGFLQEWAVRGKVGKWYLGPPLNNPALLRNVPTGVLEGMLGISPDLGANAAKFDADFESMTGVPSLAGSHYYYDAVAMLALAIAEGIAQTGVIPDPVTLKLHLQAISSAPGELIQYDDLSRGLAMVAARQKIQYSGAAGAYVLNADGDSIQNQATIWRITGSNFDYAGSELCTDAEVLSSY